MNVENLNDDVKWVEFLLKLSPYLRGKEYLNIHDLAAQLPFAFTPYNWKLGFQFSTNKAHSIHEKAFYGSATPKHALSQDLSRYLAGQSSLVASLANLASSQNYGGSEEQEKESKVPSLTLISNLPTRRLESSSPFVLALNQSSKFPVLQRHITSSFYFLSKYLVLDGMGLARSSEVISQSEGFPVVNPLQYFLFDGRSREVTEMFLQAVDFTWRNGDWKLLFSLLNSGGLNQFGALGGPEDFALEIAFVDGFNLENVDDIAVETDETLQKFGIPMPSYNLNFIKEKTMILYFVKDNCTRATLLLQNLHNMDDIKQCLKLLKFCLSKPPRDIKVLRNLTNKWQQLNFCKKVSRIDLLRKINAFLILKC